MMVFINMAKRYGAKLVTSKGKHLKFRDSLGHQISAPKTSSDFRAIRNFQSELRNKGFVDSQAKRVATPKPTAQPKPTTPTAKQRYEAGEKDLKTGTQTTFKDFMQKVDTARANTPAPVASKPAPSTAQRMAQGYDQNIAPVINRRGREVLSRIQNRERLVNKFGSVKEGMLPVPSMARRLMNNPPMPANAGTEQQDKEDKFKKQYDKKFKGYDKKIRDLRKELKASNKHRDEKLNYQYKDVTNPKRPSDPVKDLKKKGTA